MKIREGLRGLVGCCLFVFLTFPFGLLGCNGSARQGPIAPLMNSGELDPGPASDFRLVAEAWKKIQENYVDRSAVKPREMTYGAISGMVDSLGDTGHSTFLNPQMVEQGHNFARGRFKGIGAEVRMKEGRVVIVTPLDDSPAQKAGLKPGEVIEKVDEKEVAGLSLEQVVALILGPEGTAVSLTIMNPTSELTREVHLVRASITMRNITWHQLPGTKAAHLRVAGFSDGVTRDLRRAVKEIQRAKLMSIILDLRNNPGGLLDESVGAASLFLRGGNVLLEKNAQGEIRPVPVSPGGIAFEIPMVVLVNRGTASAAEIMAGALSDAHRATIVGEKTFGTGTVLREFELSDGSALLLAVEEWLTPSGRSIRRGGIVPDVVVALPPKIYPLFPYALRNMTPSNLRTSNDEQLLRAMDILNSSSTAEEQDPLNQASCSAARVKHASSLSDLNPSR